MKTSQALLKRRQFMQLNAAAVAGAALLPFGREATGAAVSRGGFLGRDTSGFYRFTMGDLEITVLSDGAFLVPADIAPMEMSSAEVVAGNVEPEEREAYLRSRMVPPQGFPIQASPVVIERNGRRLLIDAGWVGLHAPATAGHIDSALETADISRDSIDTVILTHCHPDHIGGLVDPETMQPRFANAEVVLSEVELDLWTGPDAEQRFSDIPIPLPGIQGVLRAMDDRLRLIRGGEEAVAGVRTIATPGHTPGHIAVGVESGGRQLLLVGDSITTIHASFERPEWHNFFDMDPAQAGRTRRRLLDEAATEEMLILGYHLPFPGLGAALRDGDAFRWYPAGWMVLP